MVYLSDESVLRRGRVVTECDDKPVYQVNQRANGIRFRGLEQSGEFALRAGDDGMKSGVVTCCVSKVRGGLTVWDILPAHMAKHVIYVFYTVVRPFVDAWVEWGVAFVWIDGYLRWNTEHFSNTLRW